ncbi:hypothetical protein VQ02_31275 [Methylobacterium variabile]|jgi:hypothetical protein|uniref:Uncharacterized protein n=1 Tax=Methylobacterium variabile TaxID=298794 RepID=A0A0J6S4T4_9HYPH|nr:hypothetical protein [Methylobacterium variabile]KMO28602.1 hypothetical protein VQ02_31275 [Methylobacterium variabile]
MVGLQRRPSADIIPFPAGRPRRAGGGRADTCAAGPAREADAVRGTILLFTGVRYERLPDPAEPGLPAPGRSPERRCQR